MKIQIAGDMAMAVPTVCEMIRNAATLPIDQAEKFLRERLERIATHPAWTVKRFHMMLAIHPAGCPSPTATILW